MIKGRFDAIAEDQDDQDLDLDLPMMMLRDEGDVPPENASKEKRCSTSNDITARV